MIKFVINVNRRMGLTGMTVVLLATSTSYSGRGSEWDRRHGGTDAAVSSQRRAERALGNICNEFLSARS